MRARRRSSSVKVGDGGFTGLDFAAIALKDVAADGGADAIQPLRILI